MSYRYYHKQNYHNQIMYALPVAAVEVVDVVVEAAVVAAEAVVV